MTMPAHPRRNVKETTPHAPATERARQDAALGSAVLAWRTANAIVRHANVESVPIPQAMNQLLYAGELR